MWTSSVRAVSLDMWGIDPFRENTTIASYCMHNYQCNFLRENMIGLPPQGGYFQADRQSKVALEWLEYQARQRQVHIQHAYNGGENKVPTTNYKHDGYYVDADSSRVSWVLFPRVSIVCEF